jgi:Fic family protein
MKNMKPYVPNKLPLEKLNYEKFVHLIGKANFEVAQFGGILQVMINPSVLLSPLTTQEAVLSSKIEGTQANFEEVLEYEASLKFDENKTEDIQEIINYRKALIYAVKEMDKIPISLNFIRKIHAILLDSVRGRNKAQGEFRRIQNWIGRPGSTIETASYVPPSPEKLMDFLSDLEKYIHYEEKDFLVQLAIVHAQFEIIHPFLDGNGRLGRMLIPLFLYEKKLLTSPMFYISAYLEANREMYYEKLNSVSNDNNWEDWIVFFLTAIIEQAKENTKKAKDILNLYEEMKIKINEITKSQYSIQVLDTIFELPIFKTPDFIEKSGIPKPTAMRILKELHNAKILRTIKEAQGRSPAIAMFEDLITIVE